MNPIRVKICGVRTLEEARASVEAGADALGFNFWPRSPRYVSPHDASSIVDKLPPEVTAVGVFVNEEVGRVLDIVRSVGLRAVQLHGDESPEYCRELGCVKIIKAFRVGKDFGLEVIRQYPVNSVLLDTSMKGSYGGTGKVFDWAVAIEAKRFCPIILAGGLTVENVASAALQVRPAAVDVCSGVEREPGRKDFDKLRRFLAEMARANQTIADEIDNDENASEPVSPF